MRQAPKIKVDHFEQRLLDPPYDAWGPTRHAILECGHVKNLGKTDYAPKRMACWDCEPQPHG